jgi:hypothetical protein
MGPRALTGPATFLISVRGLTAISVLLAALSAASTSRAVAIVDMDFNGVTGLENDGIGPDGMLKGGATIVGGRLVLDGSNAPEPTGAGLDIPMGDLGTFSGAEDFLVEFDFTSIDGGTGALFAADGAKFLDDSGGEFPGDQAGGLNIYSLGDLVVADLWFIGAVEVEGTFDDNMPHHVSVFYNAAEATLEMSVDDVEGDPLVVEDGEGFLRDTSHDITRLGDENNPDFGAEFNSGCRCSFDNLLIEGPTPPPVKLVVNRETGALTLEAIAASPVNINSISILSDAGALDPENYDEIDAGNPQFDPDDQWQIDVLESTEISESDTAAGANNGATLTSGQTFALGADVWQPFFDEDLEVFVFDTALGAEVRGTVEYTGGTPVLFGDLDVDGDIDVQDYVLFDNGFDEDVEGLSRFDAYFLGDLNGDETHNFEDFIAFAAAYDGANGAGAFAAVSGAGVPEPGTGLLAVLASAILLVRRRRMSCGLCEKLLAVMVLCLFSPQSTRAAELVEYLFDANFNDTSGNNRHGTPSIGVFGGTPTVSGGKLNLTGDLEEGLNVPLGAANPFDGTSDYTIEMSFSSMGSSAFPEAGVILLGSAHATEPTEPDNQSFSVFVEPQADGGSLVVDYFFVGEVRVQDAMLLDGMEHTVKITYVAPDMPGPPDDPEPGIMYLNIDGEWLTEDDIAPRPPNIASHEVRIGGSLNTDFPYECVEGECFTSELEGTVDNFRIFNDAMPPSLLRAEVDLTTGEITLVGGEFHRDIRYYEINSPGGGLNPAGWNSLEDQNVDAAGMGAGQHWDELNASASQLAEAFLLGSSSFDENREISLGNALRPSTPAQDLEITAVTEGLAPIPVEVVYINAPVGVAGDYNQNGTVDAADYVVWRDRLGAGTLPNEGGISPGVVDDADYNFWRSRFGATSGVGSSAALGSSVVPEPATWAFAVVAGWAVGLLRRQPPVYFLQGM